MSARSIHPFPARMAPEIALEAIPSNLDGRPLRILDPMCGSGTVLTVASHRGHDAIGLDIDPLAVLMSQVATTPLGTAELLEVSAVVAAAARTDDGAPPWEDRETDKFVDFWFGPSQRRDLVALASQIAGVADPALRSALRVALSRIIITKSPQASLAADTSHSRPHRVVETSEYDAIRGFERSVVSLSRLLDKRELAGSAQVSRGDSREMAGISNSSIDIAVTSPPYLNALDYMRGHKLALVWFGYAISELRRIRASSIGSERAPDARPAPQVTELTEFIQRDVAEPSRLPMGTIERFAGDMVGFASSIRRVLKPGSIAILVVGNSTLRGNYVRNDVITQRALENAGFGTVARIEREIPATSRYMAINTHSDTSTLRNRMRSEVVLTMKRPS